MRNTRWIGVAALAPVFLLPMPAASQSADVGLSVRVEVAEAARTSLSVPSAGLLAVAVDRSAGSFEFRHSSDLELVVRFAAASGFDGAWLASHYELCSGQAAAAADACTGPDRALRPATAAGSPVGDAASSFHLRSAPGAGDRDVPAGVLLVTVTVADPSR
jgi:hypothetical protein